MDRLSWLWRDLRFGLRSLNKDRRSALLAVLALALGIGATTVIFSAIDSIVLEPFAYRDAGKLTTFYIHDVNRPIREGRGGFSIPELMEYREQNHVFDDMIGYSGLDVLYTTPTGTQLLDGSFVTANAIEFLGMKPILGRWITSDDGRPNAPEVFVMSYHLWTAQFNRDPNVVGTTMMLNGVPRTLVGIMPPRFRSGGHDIWIPIHWTHGDIVNSETGNFPLFLSAMGRLKPGVSLKAAQADLNVIAQRLAKEYPERYPQHFNVVAQSFVDTVVGPFRPMLIILMTAVSFLLLIACCNVANLLLARATAREREIAIRASMGATRGRLVRQLLVESFLLAAAGCLLGCLLAYAGLKGLVAVMPEGVIPRTAVVALKPIALWFALGVTILTTLLCGLAPALHAVHGDIYHRLTGAGRGAGGGFRHGKLRAALIVFEVALSIVLVIGAGLMMRSMFALEHVDLGFNPHNLLFARLALPKGRYDTADQKRLLFQQILERLNSLPGVTASAVTISLPPFGAASTDDVTIPGKMHSDRWRTQFDLDSEGDFRTLGLSLLRGRLLTGTDVQSARRVVVINQTLASKYFKGEDPIGQTIKFNILDQFPDTHDSYFEIVGVVGDARNAGLRDAPEPEAYMPYTITGLGNTRCLLIRTATEPMAMLENVRQVIWTVDSNIALAPSDTGSLENFLTEYSYAAPRFGLITLGIFAGIGLVLVIIGVFSVMAYSVSLQTQEIGVRMALGAQQSDILKMILVKGLLLIAWGIGAGLLVSVLLTHALASQIWGVSPTDPLTFVVVPAVIVVVGLAACLLPARRATQVDPLVALRYE
ncbi:MAG: ABC transporter permease [Candidatus Acidiferrales bacterium]